MRRTPDYYDRHDAQQLAASIVLVILGTITLSAYLVASL